jgi:hypothetical protein
VGGRDVGEVPGAVLEAAYRAGGRILLLLTDDVPYEEGLHVALLSPDFRLLDRLFLGASGTTGVFRDPEPLSESELRFSFFGRGPWRLTILPEPTRGFGFLEPVGVRRRGFWVRRHMRLAPEGW